MKEMVPWGERIATALESIARSQRVLAMADLARSSVHKSTGHLDPILRAEFAQAITALLEETKDETRVAALEIHRRTEEASCLAVRSIILDLSDRRGLRHEWDRIDKDVQDEIEKKWAELIEKAFTT